MKNDSMILANRFSFSRCSFKRSNPHQDCVHTVWLNREYFRHNIKNSVILKEEFWITELQGLEENSWDHRVHPPLLKLIQLSWMLFENEWNPTSCSLLSLSLHWFPYLLASLGFVNSLGLLLALIWNSISALQIRKRWMTPSCRISSGWMCFCGDKPTKENWLVTDASDVVSQLLSCYTDVCLLLYCAANFWFKSVSLLQSFLALYHKDYFFV